MREQLSRFEPSPCDEVCWRTPRPVLIEPWHPARDQAEAFIEARFRSAFGAQPNTAYPIISALFQDDGRIAAAAGVRFPEETPLFLERYLDEPIESAVALAFARPVIRASIVEIGSFAALGVAPALALFGALSAWLAGPCGRLYAVATARPELERLLRRSGFALRAVADAEAARLGESAAAWGTYYDAAPRVFVGEIKASPVLPALGGRLHARSARSALRGASRSCS